MARYKKKIVVLGGGFAGLQCALKLENYFKSDSEYEIVLVAEDNFLLFTPMLPQVASGMIETRHVVMPLRAIIKHSTFYEGRIKNIDPYGKIVNLWGSGEKRGISLHYDYLVLALGSETNFFGMGDLEKNAYQMKTLNDAVMVRNRIIDMLEQAENEKNPILKQSLLTFVIVGGGFAGIETAGEIHDLLLDVIKYYPNISKDDIKVVVLEAGGEILPGFSKNLIDFTFKKMTEHGIEIKLKTGVTSFDGDEVMAKSFDSENSEPISIQSKTVIWTAGVTPVNTIKRSLFKTDKGRIAVDRYLEVKEFPGVFGIGDCSVFFDKKTNRPYAPTAQLAEAMAKTAAKNLHAKISNQPMTEFEYTPRGQMAIIGKRTGIASFFGMNLHGLFAWFLWRNVYLSKVPTWEKRFRVFLDWVADAIFDRDISRLKFMRNEAGKEYKELDEVDDVW